MRPRHTSGKPIRDNKPKGRPIWRVPDSGYVTPRLQDRKTDAIGFVHDFRPDQRESDDNE